MDVNSLTQHYFDWAVRSMADLCIGLAQGRTSQTEPLYRWDVFLRGDRSPGGILADATELAPVNVEGITPPAAETAPASVEVSGPAKGQQEQTTTTAAEGILPASGEALTQADDAASGPASDAASGLASGEGGAAPGPASGEDEVPERQEATS